MLRRRICVVTGSRAEYGLLRWLMTEIRSDANLKLQVVVTGMHLAPEFGMTINEILADGFSVDDIVESQLASDTRVGMVKSLGLGLVGFADSLRRLAPHIVVVLGDRYEILAVSQAASLLGIPVGHISGGEVTEGAVDDWIRHAITKAAWWHFVAAEPYSRRVVQLGEAPDRVYNVGDPGLDSVRRYALYERDTLSSELGIVVTSPLFVVTYHPATLGALEPRQAFAELLAALDEFPEVTVVMTKPNADAGGRELGNMADAWVKKRRGTAICVTSLGQTRYLSLLSYADAVIGNSSSGIVEAPALKVPTVNIGSRQAGRLRASSIVDCAENRDDITAAIRYVMTEGFRETLPNTISVYGDCDASSRIKEVLASVTLPKQLNKRFYDI